MAESQVQSEAVRRAEALASLPASEREAARAWWARADARQAKNLEPDRPAPEADPGAAYYAKRERDARVLGDQAAAASWNAAGEAARLRAAIPPDEPI